MKQITFILHVISHKSSAPASFRLSRVSSGGSGLRCCRFGHKVVFMLAFMPRSATVCCYGYLRISNGFVHIGSLFLFPAFKIRYLGIRHQVQNTSNVQMSIKNSNCNFFWPPPAGSQQAILYPQSAAMDI